MLMIPNYCQRWSLSALNLQSDLDFAFNINKYFIKFNINKSMEMHYGHYNEKGHF